MGGRLREVRLYFHCQAEMVQVGAFIFHVRILSFEITFLFLVIFFQCKYPVIGIMLFVYAYVCVPSQRRDFHVKVMGVIVETFRG